MADMRLPYWPRGLTEPLAAASNRTTNDEGKPGMNLQSVRGVYLLLRRGELFYIGMSENVQRRVHEHRAAKSFDQAYAIPMPDATREEIAALERAMIRAFNPPENRKDRLLVDWTAPAPAPALPTLPRALALSVPTDHLILSVEQARSLVGPAMTGALNQALKDGSIPVRWQGKPKLGKNGVTVPGTRRLVLRENVMKWLKGAAGV